MNERIKELLEEATEIHDDRGTGISHLVVDQKVFAELIVRDCADMAQAFHNRQYDFTGNLELHEFMLNHFGVEE
jgi:hypothetical protein